MILPAPDINEWKKIHEIASEGNTSCWKTCGGFCCNSNHKKFNFKIISKNQTFVPILSTEYDYLKTSGFLQPGMDIAKHCMELKITDRQTAKLFLARCKQCGQCTNKDFRPFYCKICPIIPKIDDFGSIVDWLPANIYDYIFHYAGEKSPCALMENNYKEERLRIEKYLIDIIKKPYFIFYFQAFNILVEHHNRGLSNICPKDKITDLNMFFLKWENLYLTSRLFNKKDIANDIICLYHKLVNIYGEFDI